MTTVKDGFIINGVNENNTNFNIINYKTYPELKLREGNDVRPRLTRWIRSIVLHTTKGIWPQTVLKGMGSFTNVGKKVANFWSTNLNNAGAHLVVDWDGTISCHCDLLTQAAYHAGVVNEVSIGIEVFQGSNGELYERQLETVAELVNWLTIRFSIQRQMPASNCYGLIKRCVAGGKDVVGVYSHRNVTNQRSRGDCGDYIFDYIFKLAKYEIFDFERYEDMRVWRERQTKVLGISFNNTDGIPGPQTVDGLRFLGYPSGLWTLK